MLNVNLLTISELFITIINNKSMKNSIKNYFKNSIFGQKISKKYVTQKYILQLKNL